MEKPSASRLAAPRMRRALVERLAPTTPATTAKVVKSSRIDLASNTKTKVIGQLNERLADGIDLSLLTKQAHWNVKGPQFIAVHEMLDMFRKEVDGHVDTIAERAVQLGGTAFGTGSINAWSEDLQF